MNGWACARCGTPIGAARYDLWCTSCYDNVIALEDAAADELASPEQRAAIRYLYKHHGLHGLHWCLDDVSRRIRRQITDFRQLTHEEAAYVIPLLRKWSYGK